MWFCLRPGPYVCAEWDFGGIAPRLLADPAMKIRTLANPLFVEGVAKYVTALANNIRSSMIYNGGCIIMVQLENEFGFWGNRIDHEYVMWLGDIWRENGITGPFYNADPSGVLSDKIRFAGMPIGLNGGHVGDGDWATAARVDPNVPAFVTEIYPGWIRHWGEGKPAPTDITNDIRGYMEKNRSFTYYMIHGGSNFAYTAGSNGGNWNFQPDLTSYDYGAPIGEQGNASFNFMKYREITQKFVEVADVPAPIPVMNVSAFTTKRVSSVFD